MVDRIPDAIQSLYLDLVEQHEQLDRFLGSRVFEAPIGSTFRKHSVDGKNYWYFQAPTLPNGVRPAEKCLGKDDSSTREDVEAGRQVKDRYNICRSHVRALVSSGVPAPSRFVGDVISALFSANLLEFDGVLIGSAALLTYGPALGIRIPSATGRARIRNIEEIESLSFAHNFRRDSADDYGYDLPRHLGSVDSSFRMTSPLPNSSNSTIFQNDKNFRIEMLEFNGVSTTQGTEASRKRASAQDLLSFLMKDPVEEVLLHRGGIVVRVPSVERFAVYYCLLKSERDASADFDSFIIDQPRAIALIEAISAGKSRRNFLAVWKEASSNGGDWVERLNAGRSRLPRNIADLLPAD